MANSNLLKEAIADAKAVRETAIANAKIALEEAFTPRLQSILSQKLTAEMEGEEEEADLEEENVVEATEEVNEEEAEEVEETVTESEEDESEEAVEETVVTEEDESEEGEEVSEGEEEEEVEETMESDEEVEETMTSEDEDEDELDLESIIRELEGELGEELDDEETEEVSDIASDEIESHEEEHHGEEEAADEVEESHDDESEESDDEEIDLDEILREMGYGDDEVSEDEEEEEAVEENNDLEEAQAELAEAMSTIKSLKGTINEVNLLNAKLLYTNKLFRSYELTNEQKMKVVETLDRTGNVREVKLVFSTLAESFKFTGTTKKQKSAKINESFASKPVASTAPSKEVITESTNTMADRFKQLANIK